MHGRPKASCKLCRGSEICEHGRQNARNVEEVPFVSMVDKKLNARNMEEVPFVSMVDKKLIARNVEEVIGFIKYLSKQEI